MCQSACFSVLRLAGFGVEYVDTIPKPPSPTALRPRPLAAAPARGARSVVPEPAPVPRRTPASPRAVQTPLTDAAPRTLRLHLPPAPRRSAAPGRGSDAPRPARRPRRRDGRERSTMASLALARPALLAPG